MVNTRSLNSLIQNSGIKRQSIASQLGISLHALSNKVNNITEFKVSEVLKLEEILHLEEDSSRAIFFAKEVENNSTSAGGPA